MDLGAIFLLLIAVILVTLFVAQPLSRRRRPPAEGGRVLSALLAERDRVLNALQELDFDFSLGKIPAGEYPLQRSNLVQRGAQVLRQIDAIAPSSSPGGLAPAGETLPPRTRRGKAGRGEPAADRVEAILAARRTARAQKAAGFCPKCGKPVMTSDAFCPSCGNALK